MTNGRPATMIVEATDGDARAATMYTARGAVPTPCFMPVGTRGAVRTLDSKDLAAIGARIVLGNTYHLMLRPGADVVADLGGLHGFAAWNGHVLTDSGGFQIFSLSPDVDEDGATFASTYDGSRHRLTPESAVRVQAQLGADIQMALDVCTRLPASRDEVAAAADRTHRWADRARAAFLAELEAGTLPAHQSQFGIIQGGIDPVLRHASANAITSTGFDGYAVGGLSVGETRAEMVPALSAATARLPVERPRYLMGVGDPAGIVEGIANGIDLFDCVLPTRLARHGTALTSAGRVNLRNAQWARDGGPLDPEMPCPLLDGVSRGYLRHLFTVHETTAMRLVTLHNLWWLFAMVDRLRAAIVDGTFAAARRDVLAVWG